MEEVRHLLPARAWTSLFLLTAVLVTPLWASASMIGPLSWLILLMLMAIIARAPMAEERIAVEPIAGRGLPEGAMVATLLLAPAIIFLAVTWRQEFPWLGDHDYHLMQSRASLAFWGIWFVPVLLAVALVAARLRRFSSSLVPLMVCAGAVIAGWFMTGDFLFSVRYPGTLYFLNTPAAVIAHAFSWRSPLNALRLTNVLSLPVWLFVLRPLIVRRWPDRALLPFGCFLFLQKDLVYYFASSYLEPWALILVAVAVERLVRYGRREAWQAWLLVGMAAVIKEQAILILPFVVVGTLAWRDRRERSEEILIAIAAGAPFVFYYLLRTSRAVWRTAGLARWSEIASTGRLQQFGRRLLLQFDVSLIALIAAIVFCAWLVVAGPRDRRRIFAALSAAALFQVVFFYSDRISLFWTGTPRFQFFPMVLVASGFLWIGSHATSARVPVVVAALLAGLNTVSLVPAVVLAAGPDPRRNFSEHFDGPVYFPVRSLISAVAKLPAFDRVRAVRFLHDSQELLPDLTAAGVPTKGTYELTLPLAYPDLSRRFTMSSEAFADDAAARCRCRNESEASAGLFVFFTGLGEEVPARAAIERQARECRESLLRTCRTSIALGDGGQVVGAIGIGLRPQLPREALHESPPGR